MGKKSEEQTLYDLIGGGYNRTRTADPFLAARLFTLLAPRKDLRCLDVGCGTGNYTVALASRGCSFYGVDPSAKMLEQAKRKSHSVFWTQASAENLPFEDEFFGAATASLTIHHWKNLEKAFTEIHRVLKNKSNLVIFTAFPEQMKKYWLNHYFPKMLKASMDVMPGRKTVEAALKSAGFAAVEEEKYFIEPDLQDLFLYSGKQRPALYLDEQVRNGISSFTVLSNKEEVENGLRKLKDDLENENFSKIAGRYESNAGDYSFVVAAKL